MTSSRIEEALRETGAQLEALGVPGPIRLYVVGGSAGLLCGLLGGSRSTGDVDVTAVDPERAWGDVREAARSIARALQLPDTWLSDRCRMFAWCLPLGWRTRCGQARTYGPLEVWLLHRRDFVAAKVVSAPNRPQDLEDLEALSPTESELDFAAENIDGLEREHLDPDGSFRDCRTILTVLREQA